MVAFSFLPQDFGRWQGPINGILLICECSLCGYYTHLYEWVYILSHWGWVTLRCATLMTKTQVSLTCTKSDINNNLITTRYMTYLLSVTSAISSDTNYSCVRLIRNSVDYYRLVDKNTTCFVRYNHIDEGFWTSSLQAYQLVSDNIQY